MKILVTGGAGFIGSVAAAHLLKAGHQVVVLDNLSHGYKEAVPSQAEFIQGDIHDQPLVNSICRQSIDAVMHFAAFIEPGESMKDPDKYFENNVVGSYNLFSEAINAGVKNFIFSSTAAVYASKDEPITETDVIKPANVYGQTKRMMEEMLEWYYATKQINVCIFRYFNAAGGTLLPDAPKLGEAHQPESHIIPRILDVALNKSSEFTLFGNDYPTPDGTCIRDYIHIDDLATAHLLGLEALIQNRFAFDIFNLGNGRGYSNHEVIDTARQVTGHPLPVKIMDRRPGDAARLVASSTHAHEILNWQPQYPDLHTIISSAWDYRKNNS